MKEKLEDTTPLQENKKENELEKPPMTTEVHVMKDLDIKTGDTYPIDVIDGNQTIHCDSRDQMKVGDEVRANWGEEYDIDVNDGTLIEHYGRTPRFFTERPKTRTEMWIVKEVGKYNPLIANDMYKRLVIVRPENPEVKTKPNE